MRKVLPFIILLTAVFACEDGLLITSPASRDYTFTMPSGDINASATNAYSESREVDVTQFFSEESGTIESIKLDKLTYQVSGYNNTSGDVVLMDLLIETQLGTNDPNTVLNITGLVVENTGLVIAFEDGNPESALSAAQVASLESIMDNLQPFNLKVTATFTQDIDSDFDVNMAWNITASIAQDEGDGG